MRALILASLAFWAGALPGQACSPIMPPLNPGETLEQTVLRMERDAQVAAWDRADSVFLARVVEAREISNGGVRYTLEAIAPVEGVQPPRRLSTAWYNSGCDNGREWSQGDVALVYADRIAFREYWLRWGQWEQIDAIAPSEAIDPRIAPALRASAQRLRTSRR